MRISILPSLHAYKVGLVLRTVLLFIPIQNGCFRAASISCSHLTDCPVDAACDFFNTSMCFQKYFSSCSNSSDCFSADSDCVSLLPNAELRKCSANVSALSHPNGFCAPQVNVHMGINGCHINTVPAFISNEHDDYCVPCTLVTSLNVSIGEDLCFTSNYTFETPPDGKKVSTFHYCYDFANCDENLSCMSLDKNGVYYPCDTYFSNAEVKKDCHCAPTEYLPCSFLSPCDSGSSCVIAPLRKTPSCVPSDSVMRVQPPMEQAATLPTWALPSIALVELIFAMIKSFTLLRKGEKWLRFALISFIFKSFIGLALTGLQSYIIIDIYMDRYSNDVDPRLVVFGALMFVFSEICVVISESVFILRKMRNDGVKTTRDECRFLFSLVRRVVVKLIAIGSTLASLGYALKNRPFIFSFIFFIILWSACIFIKELYLQYWARIIVSSIYLIDPSTAAFIILLIELQKDRYEDQCVILSFERASFLIFLLPVNIFLTAVSAFRFQDYCDTKEITAEQVELFETAVLGIYISCLVLSIILCVGTSVILFVVAIPQVFVLLAPTLIQYILLLDSKLKWSWRSETEIDFGSDTQHTNA